MLNLSFGGLLWFRAKDWKTFVLVSAGLPSWTPWCLKVTPDLRGCPRGKNSYARHFKGKHGKLCIVGKLNKRRFRKNYKLPVSSILQKKNRNQPRK